MTGQDICPREIYDEIDDMFGMLLGQCLKCYWSAQTTYFRQDSEDEERAIEELQTLHDKERSHCTHVITAG